MKWRTGLQEFRNKYLNSPKFKNHKFWIARYGEKPDSFDWQIWQKTHKGLVSGCDDCVDINVFCGDYDAFDWYLKSIAAEKLSLGYSLN